VTAVASFFNAGTGFNRVLASAGEKQSLAEAKSQLIVVGRNCRYRRQLAFMDDLKQAILLLHDEVVELRRDFHMHPELGFEEFRTSKAVCSYLKELGLEVRLLATTGVVGLLKGNRPGPTVLLRADMDALPLQEMNSVPYKSIFDGKAHACGHDAHVAMLLVAAKVLVNRRHQIGGNIKFVFQPNEETVAPKSGAVEMIKAGVLEEPAVDVAFASHLWTPIESGKIGVVCGPIMAGDEEFELTIYGKAGHTAFPQTAIDPIAAAVKVVEAVQTFQTREASGPLLIMFGKFHGGTSRNVIPEKVELGGTIRYLLDNEDEQKEALLNGFERTIKGICMATRTDYEVKYIPSNPSAYNDPEIVDLVIDAAQETLGKKQKVVAHQSMAGEDFAEFTRRVPSAFYFIGAGSSEKACNFPHHHPCFNIDEGTLLTGVEMHVRTALKFPSLRYSRSSP
jgi:amidohydrolase